MKSNRAFYLKILFVILWVYVFLISVNLMGAAFKGFGCGFAESLLRTTSNPFVGLFIGILATSIIQSSSTTTSIVVGMVASGVLTIGNAVPIIMGANIGTTVTNILVSLGHITRREEFKRAITGATVHDFFNLICVVILFPLEISFGLLEKSAFFLSKTFVNFGGVRYTSPVKVACQPVAEWVKEFCHHLSFLSYDAGNIIMLTFSFILLFFSLYFIVKLMKSLVISRAEIVLNNVLQKTGFIGIFIGLLFTIFVQSSSITTSLLIPLIGAGIITVELAFPITIGANIGTTTTAIMASFATGSKEAITIAFVHFLFNAIGAVLIYPIPAIRKIPIYLAKKFGNIAYKKRRFAVLYILGAFFVLPILLILISNLFR